jgi:hypothetical protein
MSLSISGTNCSPAISGGYLSIKRDNKEIHISSIPTPVLIADRYRDSVVENDDEFVDEEGNEFAINISSSNVGVDWEIVLSAENGNDTELARRIKLDYQPNEY